MTVVNQLAADQLASEAQGWRIIDGILHLRRWGGRTTLPMPSGRRTGTIGGARGSWLRIRSAPGRVAKLDRIDGAWVLKRLRDAIEMRVDGVGHRVVSLSPGSEIEIGGVTLVAESERLVALRVVLAQLLGWTLDRALELDLAMRSVRLAALHRDPLLLCGREGDTTSAAHLLHQHTVGTDRPFVVYTGAGSPFAALRAAATGTLCIRAGEPVRRLTSALQRPGANTQIMIASDSPRSVLLRAPIVLPRLRTRAARLDRCIDTYLTRACSDLGGETSPADRRWIRRHDGQTLGRIELAARRLVALRNSGGSITRAATMLGVAHSALSEWVARRHPLPPL